MVKKHAGRYSKYLRPISMAFDLLVINVFIYLFLDKGLFKLVPVLVFSSFWIISSLITKFYEVYRFTKLISIISYIFYQLLLFSILVFAFFGIVQNAAPGLPQTLKFLLSVFTLISLFKLSLFYALQSYRLGFGGNFRKTIIIGNNEAVHELKEFFKTQKELGYENIKTFNFNSPLDLNLQNCFEFIMSRPVSYTHLTLPTIE